MCDWEGVDTYWAWIEQKFRTRFADEFKQVKRIYAPSKPQEQSMKLRIMDALIQHDTADATALGLAFFSVGIDYYGHPSRLSGVTAEPTAAGVKITWPVERHQTLVLGNPDWQAPLAAMGFSLVFPPSDAGQNKGALIWLMPPM